jgi:beta-ribofuranosylaminobenzene 5'-phosphate synthase
MCLRSISTPFGSEVIGKTLPEGTPRTIIVSAPSRVHVTLCDLGRATPRAYGGIGFALDQPRVRIRVQAGAGEPLLPPTADERTVSAVQTLMTRLLTIEACRAFRIEVEALPPQHSGTGTKTALLLAIAAGVNELFELNLTREQVQRISGRGGTSGIGIHSFFSGGIIWDAGHPQDTVAELVPSGARRPEQIPLCLCRLPFPEKWRICLIRPPGCCPSGQTEREIFHQSTPIPKLEVIELLSWIAHGVIPALREESLPTLAAALRVISHLGFKAREIAYQSEGVRTLLAQMHRLGLAAGMSSLGPTLFAIIEGGDHDKALSLEALAKQESAEIQWTNGCNRGAFVGADA